MFVDIVEIYYKGSLQKNVTLKKSEFIPQKDWLFSILIQYNLLFVETLKLSYVYMLSDYLLQLIYNIRILITHMDAKMLN